MPTSAQMIINGELVGAGDGRTMLVHDPGRPADIVWRIPDATDVDVDRAVRAAFLSWRQVPLGDRVALLLKAADQVGPIVPEVTELITREMGKVVSESLIDVGGAEYLLRNIAGMAEGALAETTVSDESGMTLLTPAPLGVVAAIVPSNWAIGYYLPRSRTHSSPATAWSACRHRSRRSA